MNKIRNYKLIEVTDKRSVKEFLKLPVRINKGDPNWIRPLDEDIEKVFHPIKNKLFKKGNAIRWILANDKNEIVGRIAAFYDRTTARKFDQPTGGCGFFECINEQEAANTLFDAAREWLKENKMEAMDGPVNFGSRELFWGCLADGFTEPIYNMPYNPAYYNDLFQNYGFKNYFNQYTYHRAVVPGVLDQVMYDQAEHLKKNENYVFRNFESKKLEKYAEDFVTIFNEAWAVFPGVSPMRKAHGLALFKSLKPIHDSRAIIFGYYKERPIAFYIMVPDMYQVTRKFNGKLNFINKLRLVYEIRYRRSCTRLIGLVFGIVPEFQGKGVAAGIVKHFEDLIIDPKFKYTDLEMNWIGDFNPGMMKLVDKIGGKIYKTHVTYRYLFDRDTPFTRAKRVS